MQKVIPFVLIFLFISSLDVFANTSMVRIDSKDNCCMKGAYKHCAKKVVLQPGRYVLRPVEGALSRWQDDYSANANGEVPWEWHVWFNDGFKKNNWALGMLNRYETKSEALKHAKQFKKNITLGQETTLYI